jgi:hypothetical protein
MAVIRSAWYYPAYPNDWIQSFYTFERYLGRWEATPYLLTVHGVKASFTFRGDTLVLTLDGRGHVFRFTELWWTQTQTVNGLDGEVAMDDERVIGSSASFRRNGSTLEYEGPIPAAGAAAAALDGNVALFGMPDASAEDSKVMVFIRNGNQWLAQTPLYPAVRQIDSGFGTSLALENGTALVGASKTDRIVPAGDTAIDNGRVHVFESDPLTWWRAQRLGSPDNSGSAADAADPDNDGTGNLAEFAFGLDPLLGDTHLLPAVQALDGNLVFRFTPPPLPVNIIYGAESSATMEPGAWTEIPDTGTGAERLFGLPMTESRRFVRLKVAAPSGE